MSERQEIYDRIRAAGGRDKVILEEMVRKGFWKPGTAETAIPEALLKREAELVSELRSLSAQQRRYQNREVAESRRKQKEAKERCEQERQARAAAWERRKQDEILHLGDDASSGLNQLESRHDRLARHGLPDFPNHRALAQAMVMDVGELRFLAYGRKVA
jgi:RNA-directed DNA polymerase